MCLVVTKSSLYLQITPLWWRWWGEPISLREPPAPACGTLNCPPTWDCRALFGEGGTQSTEYLVGVACILFESLCSLTLALANFRFHRTNVKRAREIPLPDRPTMAIGKLLRSAQVMARINSSRWLLTRPARARSAWKVRIPTSQQLLVFPYGLGGYRLELCYRLQAASRTAFG